MVDSSKIQLGYWKIRGLAQQIRYELVYLDVPFEDVMYELGDGPDFDNSCWASVKPTLGMDFPNLPYMIDGDFKLTETPAIMKYIAQKYD